MYMIEKIFDRSRLWKEFMVERLGLPASRAQAGFVDIIVESGIEEKTFFVSLRANEQKNRQLQF